MIRLVAFRSRFHFTTREKLFGNGLKFYKISVLHANASVLVQVKEKLLQDPEPAVASSDYTNLEITHDMAQKGKALIRYARQLGIQSKEIMALGDSENDRSMLSLPLGYTLAMENGMESIKQVVRCQTRSNARDGVAFAIDTLLIQRGRSVF